MSTMDVMRRVRKAEGEAEELRKSASAQAREMLRSVEGASVQQERQAAQDLRAKVAAYHREEDQKVDKEIERVMQDERFKLKAERENANARVNTAVDLIYERILEHGDR